MSHLQFLTLLLLLTLFALAATIPILLLFRHKPGQIRVLARIGVALSGGAALVLMIMIGAASSPTMFSDPQASSQSSSQSIDWLDESSDDPDEDASTSSFDDEEAAGPETIAFGTAITFTSGETVTVLGTGPATNSEMMDLKSGQTAVSVEALVENTTDAPIDFNAQYFDLYDNDDELGNFDAQSYDNNIPSSIAAHKKARVVMYFDVDHAGRYSVTYGEATWVDSTQ